MRISVAKNHHIQNSFGFSKIANICAESHTDTQKHNSRFVLAMNSLRNVTT